MYHLYILSNFGYYFLILGFTNKGIKFKIVTFI